MLPVMLLEAGQVLTLMDIYASWYDSQASVLGDGPLSYNLHQSMRRRPRFNPTPPTCSPNPKWSIIVEDEVSVRAALWS
jgi:hypothetical protein